MPHALVSPGSLMLSSSRRGVGGGPDHEGERSGEKSRFEPPQTRAPRSCRAGTQRMSFCTKYRLPSVSRREALMLDPSAAGAGETGGGTYHLSSIAKGIPFDGPSR